MAYIVVEQTIDPRNVSLAYNDVGPGMYPDESVIMKNNQLLALSVVPKWLDNNAGVSCIGFARHINADGSTKLTDHNSHVETSLSFTADLNTVERLGIPAIAKEILLALLGEPLTKQTINNEEHDIIMWSDEVKLNANIINAITITSQTGPTAINPADIL